MLELMIPTTLSMQACSSSVSGFKSAMYPVLSSSCSILLMPESTILTPGRLAANRMAQEGTDMSGW